MDSQTIHGHPRSVESLEKSVEMVHAMVAAEPNPNTRIAIRAGGYDAITQDAIATARQYRDVLARLNAEVESLEQAIRELEGDDPEGSMHAAADLDASRGMD